MKKQYRAGDGAVEVSLWQKNILLCGTTFHQSREEFI